MDYNLHYLDCICKKIVVVVCNKHYLIPEETKYRSATVFGSSKATLTGVVALVVGAKSHAGC